MQAYTQAPLQIDQFFQQPSFKPELLQNYINQIILKSNDIFSYSFKIAKSAFQQYISSQYRLWNQRNEGSYFLQELFAGISFSKLNQNTFHYLIINCALLDVDFGSKPIKAFRIAKDLVLIQPSSDPLVWSLIEKALVWISHPLGTSLHLTLQPLRDLIWKWYFLQTEDAIIASLYLADLFIRKFPSSLNANYESIQSLLLRTLQHKLETIQKVSGKVLLSTLNLLQSPFSSHVQSIFRAVFHFMTAKDTPVTPGFVRAVYYVFKKSPTYCSILKFNDPFISRLSLSESPVCQSAFAMLPLIYRCSPRVFTQKHISALHEVFSLLLVQKPSNRQMLFKCFGELFFLLDKGLRIINQKIVDRNVIDLSDQIDCAESAYAYLSIVSPESDRYSETMVKMFTLPPSKLLSKGLKWFCDRWPGEAHFIRTHILAMHNIPLLSRENKTALILALKSVSLFEFTNYELSIDLLMQYSLALKHESAFVRECTANFMLSQQRAFPELKQRLISFVSSEPSEELRIIILKKLVPTDQDVVLVMPLYSLLHDYQSEVRFIALQLLSMIGNAQQFITNYISELVQCLNQSSVIDKRFVKSLLISADFCPHLLSPFRHFLIEHLLNSPVQRSASLLLLSRLVKGLTLDDLLPKIVPQIINNLSLHSSSARISAALDLLIVTLESSSLRRSIKTQYSNLLLKISHISNGLEYKEPRAKLYKAIVLIGLIRKKSLQQIEQTEQSPMVYFPYLSEVSFIDSIAGMNNVALCSSLSLLIDIISDKGLSTLHSQTIEAILTILKNYRQIDPVIEEKIVEQFCNMIVYGDTATISVVLHNISSIISVFGDHISPVIPNIIDLLCSSWGKIDTALLLRAIEWMGYKIPNTLSQHLYKITSMLVSSLPIVSAKIADDIFSTFVTLGDIIQQVDYLIIPSMLQWLETHVDDTQTSELVLEKLKSILLICGCEKYCGEVIRTLIVLIQHNQNLQDRSFSVLILLAFRLNRFFLPFLPELVHSFDITKCTSLQLVLKCLSSDIDLPQYITDEYQVTRSYANSTSKKSIERPLQKDGTMHKIPPQEWDAAEWSHWADEFIPVILLSSPSRAISACYPVAERNPNVRSSLFPVSFAMSIAYNKENENFLAIIKSALSSNKIPSSLLRMFLSSVDHLEIHGVRVPIDDSILSERSISTGQYAQALRFNERIFATSPNTAAERLVVLYLNLGLNSAALGILKSSNFPKDDTKYWDLSMKLGLWEESLEYFMNRINNGDSSQFTIESNLMCLEGMCKYQELGNLATRFMLPKYMASASWRLFDNSKLRSAVASFTERGEIELYYRACLCVIDGDYEGAEKIIASIEEDLSSRVIENISFNFDRNFADIALANQLSELRDVISISKCQKMIQSMSPENAVGLVNQVSGIKTSWREKISQMIDVPLFMFDVLRIRSIVLTKDEMRPYWLMFIKNASIPKYSELRSIALSQIDSLENIDIKLLQCKIYRENNETEKSTNQLKELISSICQDSPYYLKWQPILARWQYKEGNFSEAKAEFELSIKHSSKNPEIWHAYSKACLAVSTNQENVLCAMNALLTGLKLGPHNHIAYAQKAVSLIFQFGTPELFKLFLSSLTEISVSVWIDLLPQIIARLGTDDENLRDTICKLVLVIGDKYPHSVIYSLMVQLRSTFPSRKSIAELLIESIRIKFPELTSSMLTMTQELIRVSFSWLEKWFSSIDEVSREYASDKAALPVYEKFKVLHELIQQSPETHLEDSFRTKFGPEFAKALSLLESYVQSNEESNFHQAWLMYTQIYKTMKPIVSSLTEVSLQSASPILASMQKTGIVVPGTFACDKPLVYIDSFGKSIPILKSKQRPRKLTLFGTDGVKYSFLLKANEDTRLDERVMQLFSFINHTIKESSIAHASQMTITVYKVVPITGKVGLIGWVPNCQTTLDVIQKLRTERNTPLFIESGTVIQSHPNYDTLQGEEKYNAYLKGFKGTSGDEIEYFLLNRSLDSQHWLNRRNCFATSLASNSMAGYILGLGDRHFANIMIMNHSAKLVHIDFADCFEVAMSRATFPEKVPFRLTRLLVNALGVAKTEGLMKSCCISLMSLLRENGEQIMELLEAFIYDPLMQWTSQSKINRPEIEIIQRIRDKLVGKEFDENSPLTVSDQVNRLINEATDSHNLAQMYRGWYPWW